MGCATHASTMPTDAGSLTLVDVLVLHRTGTGWLCEIEGRRVFIGQLQVEPGELMPGEGQRGPIVIAAHAVADVRDAIRRALPSA